MCIRDRNVDSFENVDADYIKSISSNISSSITESTLHGCPPDEIERIATYLITEKHLHTFIKCNPTLLGYEYARKRLDELGFDYVAFDDHHFVEDLQLSLIHIFKDYIMYRLTNVFATDLNCFGGAFMVDMNTMDYSRELMDLYGIPELYDALPKLATEPTEIVGTVTKEASEITGLAEGTPVAAGMLSLIHI